jgi:hypothetical protein
MTAARCPDRRSGENIAPFGGHQLSIDDLDLNRKAESWTNPAFGFLGDRATDRQIGIDLN